MFNKSLVYIDMPSDCEMICLTRGILCSVEHINPPSQLNIFNSELGKLIYIIYHSCLHIYSIQFLYFITFK